MALDARLAQAIGWAVAQLDDRERARLHRLVMNDLHPPPSAAERRARELAPLAAMLAVIPPSVDGYPTIKRTDYDYARPDGALSSATLVRRYGRWHVVCASAYLVSQDGTYAKDRPWPQSRPWPAWNLGQHNRRRYTRGDCVAALHTCEAALDRVPTYMTYVYWSRERRRRDRERGIDARLPTIEVFNRLFPDGGFYAAVALAFPDN